MRNFLDYGQIKTTSNNGGQLRFLSRLFWCKESKKNADEARSEVRQKAKSLKEVNPSKNSELLDAQIRLFLDNHYESVIILLD